MAKPINMTRFFTLIIFYLLASNSSRAQLVLNEAYTDPGAGKHEFFELFNPELGVEPTDNYTMVTFFMANSGKGFYVLDLPTLNVPSRGFFVASAATPFNYQGTAASAQTSLNWNDAGFMAVNNGKLMRWDCTTTNQNTTDNNLYYDGVNITNLNDFFARLTGSGSSFVILLYKNGVVVNSGIFGSGGSTTVPAELLAMPPLFVDMTGNSPDFTIDFSAYGNLPVEKVNQDAGTDNGFIRKANGSCGSWTKSSSQNMHTPLTSNGNEVMSAGGSVAVTASIKVGTYATGSELSYSIGTEYASQLPVQLYVYVDNGSMLAQLDVNDQLLASHSVTQTALTYKLTFKPYDQNIIIVTKKPAGCIDHTRLVPNVAFTSLPLELLNFYAQTEADVVRLNWSVANNEQAKSFEMQSSADGMNFSTVKEITSTSRSGNENYVALVSTVSSNYARLKLKGKDGAVSYSSTIMIGAKHQPQGIHLFQNPVASQLSFSSFQSHDVTGTIRIYTLTGTNVFSSAIFLKKGQNNTLVKQASDLKPGMYVLELNTGRERSVVKFIKG
jgi:hypothetical protein